MDPVSLLAWPHRVSIVFFLSLAALMVLLPMFSSLSLLATALLASSLHAATIARQQGLPTVNIKNGSYYGLHNPTYNQDLFLGMPFAQPPLNDLRFNLPMSLNTSWTKAKNATQYGYECYGYGSDQWVLGNIVGEDCLTLNVSRPSGMGANAELPIGVFTAAALLKAAAETHATI